MTKLTIQVDSDPAPFTTQMRRFDKGLEQFYYALLLTGDKRYWEITGPWRSWLNMGFHVQTRSHPPAVEKPDRLAIVIRPDGKATHIQLTSENTVALQRLEQLLKAMEEQRVSMKGADDSARLRKLLDSHAVATQLMAPVSAALKKSEFLPDEAKTVQAMLHRGLAAFADDEIKTVKVSLA